MESGDELDLGLDVSVDDIVREIITFRTDLFPESNPATEYITKFEKLLNELNAIDPSFGIIADDPVSNPEAEQKLLEEVTNDDLAVITIDYREEVPVIQIDSSVIPTEPPANQIEAPPVIQHDRPADIHVQPTDDASLPRAPSAPLAIIDLADDTARDKEVKTASVFDRLAPRPRRKGQFIRNPYARDCFEPAPPKRFMWDTTAKEFEYNKYFTVVQTFGQEIYVPKRCRNKYRQWKHKVPVGRIQLRWDLNMNLATSRLTPSNGP